MIYTEFLPLEVSHTLVRDLTIDTPLYGYGKLRLLNLPNGPAVSFGNPTLIHPLGGSTTLEGSDERPIAIPKKALALVPPGRYLMANSNPNGGVYLCLSQKMKPECLKPQVRRIKDLKPDEQDQEGYQTHRVWDGFGHKGFLTEVDTVFVKPGITLEIEVPFRNCGLFFVWKGSGICQSETSQLLLTPGRFLCVFPGTTYAIKSSGLWMDVITVSLLSDW